MTKINYVFFTLFLAAAVVTLGLMRPVFTQAQETLAQAKTPVSPQAQPREPYFQAGEQLEINDNIFGDLYVTGGKVVVNGSVDGDILVVGGEVLIAGQVTQDIRALGGTIDITGQVGGSVTALGGTVTFQDDSVIAGSVVVGGSSITTRGLIAEKAWFGGDEVTLSGDFGGDVQVHAQSFTVLPATTITGSLVAQVTNAPDVSEVAQIGESDVTIQAAVEPSKQQIAQGVVVFSLAAAIFTAISTMTVGSILIYFFPRLTQKVTLSILKGPLVTLGWGTVSLLVIPCVVIFLAITLVGLPLAVLGLMGYMAGLVVAQMVAAIALGAKIAETTKSTALSEPYAQLLLGVIILSVVGLIPVIGWLVKVVALLLGLGALFIAFKSGLRVKPLVVRKLKLG